MSEFLNKITIKERVHKHECKLGKSFVERLAKVVEDIIDYSCDTVNENGTVIITDKEVDISLEEVAF